MAIILKASYAGRFGRRLLGQADSSQLIEFTDKASGETMSQAITSLELQTRAGAAGTAIKPEPYFEHLYGATLLNNANSCDPKKQYVSATNCIADGH